MKNETRRNFSLEKSVLIIAFIFGLFGFLILLATALVYYLKGYINSGEIDSNLFGTFGDFIGGIVGTLFTISATILVWLTYSTQRKELEATNQIASLQSQTQSLAQFETTFFNLITNFRNVSRSLSGDLPVLQGYEHDLELSGEVTYVSKDYLNYVYDVLNHKLYDELHFASVKQNKKDAIFVFNSLYDEFLNGVNQYFELVALILKFIESSNVGDRRLYTKIFSSQLSIRDYALIYLYGISEIGRPKILHLIEKLHFLDNMPHSTYYNSIDVIQYEYYPFTMFNFYTDDKKDEIFINALNINPDDIKFDAEQFIIEYYSNKYNYSQNDLNRIVNYLKAPHYFGDPKNLLLVPLIEGYLNSIIH